MKPEKSMDQREIDKKTREVHYNFGSQIVFIKKTKISTWKAVFIIAFAIGVAAGTITIVYLHLQTSSNAEAPFSQESGYVHHPELMRIIKTRGCVADGVFTGSGGDTAESIQLIERSQCLYLHRAVETWVKPPDFTEIRNNLEKLKGRGIIYGMFISEALDKNATYYFPDEGVIGAADIFFGLDF